jgi:hypothetical protein
MGRGIRSWFRCRGYRVFLVDEARTSLTCSKCYGQNEYNWQVRGDSRPWMGGKEQRVWGLSRCINSQCRKIHNRNVNSSSNILDIACCHLGGEERPNCFRRTTNHTRASHVGDLTS